MTKKLYVYIFVFYMAIFAIFSNGHYGGDGLENYFAAESIVLDKNIRINDKPFAVKEMKYIIRGKHDSRGQYYSSAGIGVPILLTPLYALGHLVSKAVPQIPHDYITQFSVSFFNPLVTALIALLLFIFAQNLGLNAIVSFIATICFSFCSMAFIYTRSGFSEPVLSLFVLISLFLMYKFEEKGKIKYLFLASVFTGYTLLMKGSSLFYFGLFGIYLLYKSIKVKSVRSLTKICFAAIPLVLFLFIYMYLSANTKSDMSPVSAALGTIMKRTDSRGQHCIKGLFYYLLSPGKGFFFYNAPLLLALLGIGAMLKKKKKIIIYFLIFIAAHFVFYPYIFIRGSLFSWGPRYLYPILPVMCIFLGRVIEDSKTTFKRILLFFCLLGGFLIQVPSLFVNITNYINFVKEKIGLPEYYINFIPDLSPIYGNTYLFISSIIRKLFGTSLLFQYNPDSYFVTPITLSLQGYDTWDVWWFNVVNIYPQTMPLVVAIVAFLSLVSLVSLLKIKSLLFKKA